MSVTAHTAYRELLRTLLDEVATDIRGTPTRLERNGTVYWYDSFRIGCEVHKRYIGKASPELGARIAWHKQLAAISNDRRQTCRRLVGILRSEQLLSVDSGTGSLLAALARAGVFRLGGTVVGTMAFRLYEAELGVRMTMDQAAMAGGIDMTSFERLSLALADLASPPLGEVLEGFSFELVPSLEANKVWRWRQTRGQTLVAFLTPSFDMPESLRELPALGVSAQSLHHLDYLLAEPIKAAILYRSGVLVQIPRPERFAIHKLIVADRRQAGPGSPEARKDRLQAAFLVEILAEDRPDELQAVFADAMARGRPWRERITRSLDRMPEAKRLLEAL